MRHAIASSVRSKWLASAETLSFMCFHSHSSSEALQRAPAFAGEPHKPVGVPPNRPLAAGGGVPNAAAPNPPVGAVAGAGAPIMPLGAGAAAAPNMPLGAGATAAPNMPLTLTDADGQVLNFWS